MSYTPYPQNTEVKTDASGRTRSSLMSTLFDGKCLNSDDTRIWETTGTGTSSFSGNMMNLSVTSGQYVIRRGRHTTPYFSGKSQIMEITFDNFAPQANVVKRSGYFTSNSVVPFNTTLDGFWVESDDTTIRLKVYNNGTEILNLPWTSWDNYQSIQNYNWNNFTICLFDFLWLGGSELRLFLKTETGFVLAHTYKHASTKAGLFVLSPQKSVRYEVRSTTGSGSMNAICAQVSSEGSQFETGRVCSVINTAAVATNIVGTFYALKGIKKSASFRDIAIAVTSASVANITNADAGILLILLNPTLSAPMTYSANSNFLEGTATTQTVTSLGRVLAAIPSGTTGAAFNLNDSILFNVGMTAADVSDEIVLAYQPTSATQSVFGSITVKET